MEAAEEAEGSLFVDLNENQQGEGGGAALGSYVALKDRNAALLLGVSSGSGAPEAGKVNVYLTGNGRSFPRDESAAPTGLDPPGREILLDLVAAAEGRYLPARLADGCVISEVCGGLNGFTESPCQSGQEEATAAGLDGRRGVGGRPAAASCPPVLRVTETRHQPPVDSEGQSPDSDDGSPPEGSADCAAVTGCIRTSLPRGRLPCTGRQQRCYPGAEVNMANGGQEDWTHSELFPRSCDVAGVEMKVANGNALCPGDRCEQAPSPDTTRSSPRLRPRPACGCDLSRTSPCHCAADDAPVAVEATHRSELGTESRESSPERPLSEPGLMEDEEGLGSFSLPARPLTLRTSPGLPVSLSCDATPLSPDLDGPFYFGDDGDLRVALEAGRRQSAPDKVPEHPEGTDSKMMPKRFGIADFFTRYDWSCLTSGTSCNKGCHLVELDENQQGVKGEHTAVYIKKNLMCMNCDGLRRPTHNHS